MLRAHLKVSARRPRGCSEASESREWRSPDGSDREAAIPGRRGRYRNCANSWVFLAIGSSAREGSFSLSGFHQIEVNNPIFSAICNVPDATHGGVYQMIRITRLNHTPLIL